MYFLLELFYQYELKVDIVKLGSGPLSGKILLVRIIENNKIDAYFRAGKVK